MFVDPAPVKLEPFILSSVLVEKPWGGHRLADFGKDLPEATLIGESWEVADLPDHVATDVFDPRSRVASGPFSGETLCSLIELVGEELLGPVQPTAEGRFPLLVKLLDAREHLSVQVHPHRQYVATHPGARLKTESWYVIAAEPGSVLFHGLVPDADPESVAGAIGTPDLVQFLNAVPAIPGSFHHVPAGLVHSLGAGVMVAEVQTPSDTTFRLYDWAAEYGRAPRQMHFEQGAASILFEPPVIPDRDPWLDYGHRDLTVNEHYWIREHRQVDTEVHMSRLPGPRVLMVISGSAAVGQLELSAGATAVVPAAAIGDPIGLDGEVVFLEVGLTPPGS